MLLPFICLDLSKYWGRKGRPGVGVRQRVRVSLECCGQGVCHSSQALNDHCADDKLTEGIERCKEQGAREMIDRVCVDSNK